MLHLYRRHLKACPHRSMTYKSCRCPIWCFGSVAGKRVRRALDTVNWKTAEEALRDLSPDEIPEKMLVEAAADRFVDDCKRRQLAKETIGKYELLAKELKAQFPARDIRGITADDLARYCEGWKMSPVSAGKKLDRLKAFFRLCMNRGWRKGNPAASLKAPVAKPRPTMPLDDDDFEKIVWATELFSKKGSYREGNRIRVRAFVRLLRYSGLRIRDAVMLSYDKLKDNKLLLYSAKTGVPVHLRIPQYVIDDLHFVYDLIPGNYFFWSGEGEVKSAVNDWQRTLGRLSKLSGVKFHAHMLRDSFAVDLLRNGVSLENVAVLLGNSVKIAERHYAPWVKSRQDALEKEIEKAWKLN